MNNLNFLLRISNNAGALIGDVAESAVEEKRKVAARNRQVRSLKADKRLPELYEDIRSILMGEKKTGQAIFKELQKRYPAKYPASKRTTAVRDIEHKILPHEQLTRELREPGPYREKTIEQMWAETAKRV